MLNESKSHLCIACGGTGGHLFPGISIAESWVKQGKEATLLISNKKIDSLASKKYKGLNFKSISSIAKPSFFSFKIFIFIFKFIFDLIFCLKLFKNNNVEVVLGMGGFTSTAPLLASKILGLSNFIHESNAIAGKANLLNSKISDCVLLGVEECKESFSNGNFKVELTGTPIRSSLVKIPTKDESYKYFNLDPSKKTILIMGGSQGAMLINELISKDISFFKDTGVQILHVCGSRDYNRLKERSDNYKDVGILLEFCSEMQFAYAIADLIIARSGASTLAEIIYYKVPSILIPFPFAADNHQEKNAEILLKNRLCEMWNQNTINENTFVDKILKLINDDNKILEIKNNFDLYNRKINNLDPVQKIIEIITQNN